ncbi:seven-hairpin glycosidase [Coprinopsis marcescibilis]|nr:seven-hairpin glycosidase [Coprinopsis marcescibilis]
MLPRHNPSPSTEAFQPHSATTRQDSKLSILGRRPVIRWIALAFILLIGLWSFAPWNGPTAIVESRPKQWIQKGQPKPADPIQPNPPHGGQGQHEKEKEQAKGGVGGVGDGDGDAKPAVGSNIWTTRKEEVKTSFMHAWKGYMLKAFPNDELRPVSGRAKNTFNGWSVSIADSLSTMWLMGLRTEFNDGVKAIRKERFENSTSGHAPFFETVIRHLGGYLSAYALSGEPILLTMADDLGRKLLPAFNTESHLPAYSVNPSSGELVLGSSGSGKVLLAELGSCQLEYKYLAKLTGRHEYYERVEAVMEHLYKAPKWEELWANEWSLKEGKPITTRYTIAATADSTYEYLLKQYLQFGDTRALDQYLKSMDSVIQNMLFLTPNRNLLYLTDLYSPNSPSHSHEHLGCFLGGLLALGAHAVPADKMSAEQRRMHGWAAEGLGYTCWVMYHDQESGLGSDGIRMVKGDKWVEGVEKWKKRGGGKGSGKPPGVDGGERGLKREQDRTKRDYLNTYPEQWLMRPETVETMYVLWKTTGDPIWRERGYTIYRGIEKNAKATWGYSSVSNVDTLKPSLHDEMPSYFLAETLKYLYLLFDDEDPISFDKWIFNTEAHPLPVFNWTSVEREAFGVVL